MPEIELKKIQPNRLNPRLEFRKQALDELADSIRQVGILEPIIIRPQGNDGYEVVVGERRYRAAHQAGLDKVPATIRDYTDEEVLEINLIENIQREDLSAVEKGRVCKELLEKFPQKYPGLRALGRQLGMDHATIAGWIETTRLPESIQAQIAPGPISRTVPPGKIDYWTAVSVVKKVKEPERASELVEKIAQQRISRRQAIEVATQAERQPSKSIQQVIRQVIDEAPIYLPFSKVHADAIVEGVKTQTSRKSKDPRLQAGTVVRAQITHFADLAVEAVHRKRLGDFDEEDARREGAYTLGEFKEVWKSLHGAWDPDEVVYVIHFRVVQVVGEEA